jgi:hypothetical protein
MYVTIECAGFIRLLRNDLTIMGIRYIVNRKSYSSRLRYTDGWDAEVGI